MLILLGSCVNKFILTAIFFLCVRKKERKKQLLYSSNRGLVLKGILACCKSRAVDTSGSDL